MIDGERIYGNGQQLQPQQQQQQLNQNLVAEATSANHDRLYSIIIFYSNNTPGICRRGAHRAWLT